MSHPTESCLVDWDEKEKLLFFPEKIPKFARGLTKTLVAQFSPVFSFSVALSDIARKPKKRGRFHGNQTDRNIVLWIEKGLSDFQDPRFEAVRRVVKEKRWIPVAAQIPVGCSHLRLATKIDFICQNIHKEIIILELKCGFDDYFNVHNQGCFQYPLNMVHISFRNRAFMQLLLTCFLFFHCQNEWNRQKFQGAYILHVFESDTTNQFDAKLSALPFWMFCSSEIIEQILFYLKQSRNENKRKRSTLIQNGTKRAKYGYRH